MNFYEEQIEAFQIFNKYALEDQHQRFRVAVGYCYTGPHPDVVSAEDKARLKMLGWVPKSADSCFVYKKV